MYTNDSLAKNHSLPWYCLPKMLWNKLFPNFSIDKVDGILFNKIETPVQEQGVVLQGSGVLFKQPVYHFIAHGLQVFGRFHIVAIVVAVVVANAGIHMAQVPTPGIKGWFQRYHLFSAIGHVKGIAPVGEVAVHPEARKGVGFSQQQKA